MIMMCFALTTEVSPAFPYYITSIRLSSSDSSNTTVLKKWMLNIIGADHLIV